MPIPLGQHVLNRYIAYTKFVFKTHGQLFWPSGICSFTTSRTLQYKRYVDSKNKKYQKNTQMNIKV